MVDVTCDPDTAPKLVGGGEVVAKMIRMTIMIMILLPSLKPRGKKELQSDCRVASPRRDCMELQVPGGTVERVPGGTAELQVPGGTAELRVPGGTAENCESPAGLQRIASPWRDCRELRVPGGTAENCESPAG